MDAGPDLESRIRQLETLLQKTETLAQMGSWDWEIGPDRLHCSRGLHVAYGIPDAKIEKLQDYLDIMTPARCQAFLAILNKALADHKPYVFEAWIVRPCGEQRFVQGRGRVVLGVQGTPERVVGILRDITEGHRAEQALQASEAKLRAVVDCSPDGVVIRDFDGNYLLINEAGAAMVGLRAEEAIGMNLSEVFDPATVERIRAGDREMLESGVSLRAELTAQPSRPVRG